MYLVQNLRRHHHPWWRESNGIVIHQIISKMLIQSAMMDIGAAIKARRPRKWAYAIPFPPLSEAILQKEE